MEAITREAILKDREEFIISFLERTVRRTKVANLREDLREELLKTRVEIANLNIGEENEVLEPI
jgi:hypothetical protein